MSIPGAVAATAGVFLVLSCIFAVAAGEAVYDRNRQPLLTLASVSLGLAAAGFIASAWLAVS